MRQTQTLSAKLSFPASSHSLRFRCKQTFGARRPPVRVRYVVRPNRHRLALRQVDDLARPRPHADACPRHGQLAFKDDHHIADSTRLSFNWSRICLSLKLGSLADPVKRAGGSRGSEPRSRQHVFRARSVQHPASVPQLKDYPACRPRLRPG